MTLQAIGTTEYALTEKEAAIYARIPLKLLQGSNVPYLQYADKLPRFYRKTDLDAFINSNVHNSRTMLTEKTVPSFLNHRRDDEGVKHVPPTIHCDSSIHAKTYTQHEP